MTLAQIEILCAAVSVGKDPPKEFRIFGPGMNVTENGTGLFDSDAAKAVMEAYKAHGVDKMIDLEHLSLDEDSKHFDPDARGWMKLELRGSPEQPELWATDVSWTPDGERRLKEKTQRYISPAFAVDKKTRRIVKLHNVAITGMPATHGIAPLVAAASRKNVRANANGTYEKEETMALAGKDAELASAWLSQIKQVAESAEDPGLKELAMKVAEALTPMVGEEAASKIAAAKPPVPPARNSSMPPPGDDDDGDDDEKKETAAIAAAARKITGKSKRTEVTVVLASMKEKADMDDKSQETIKELVTEVASLKSKEATREVEKILAANRNKCTPALEKWALGKTPDEVKAVLEAVPARTEIGAELQVQHEDPNTVTLTAADRELCKSLGTDETEFLKTKQEIAKTPRAQFAASVRK